MNVWANWLRPAPSYFDRITGIVEQLVELECDMRDGENAVVVAGDQVACVLMSPLMLG